MKLLAYAGTHPAGVLSGVPFKTRKTIFRDLGQVPRIKIPQVAGHLTYQLGSEYVKQTCNAQMAFVFYDLVNISTMQHFTLWSEVPTAIDPRKLSTIPSWYKLLSL